jgi:hypothetical protein
MGLALGIWLGLKVWANIVAALVLAAFHAGVEKSRLVVAAVMAALTQIAHRSPSAASRSPP